MNTWNIIFNLICHFEIIVDSQKISKYVTGYCVPIIQFSLTNDILNIVCIKTRKFSLIPCMCGRLYLWDIILSLDVGHSFFGTKWEIK